MVRTAILIVKIISMFPHIKGQQRSQPTLHGIAGIGFLRDLKFAFVVYREPHPARAEQGGTLFRKLLLESVKRAKLLVDPLGNNACWFVVNLGGTELREIKIMVQNLASVVEHASFRCLHDVFKRHIFIFCTFYKAVEVIDIGLQMFAMMESKGFLADDGFECVSLVRQLNKFKFFHIVIV